MHLKYSLLFLFTIKFMLQHLMNAVRFCWLWNRIINYSAWSLVNGFGVFPSFINLTAFFSALDSERCFSIHFCLSYELLQLKMSRNPFIVWLFYSYAWGPWSVWIKRLKSHLRNCAIYVMLVWNVDIARLWSWYLDLLYYLFWRVRNWNWYCDVLPVW